MANAHPGFAVVKQKIQKKQGISADRAGAILGAAAKKTSKAGLKKNPRIKKVLKAQHGGMRKK